MSDLGTALCDGSLTSRRQRLKFSCFGHQSQKQVGKEVPRGSNFFATQFFQFAIDTGTTNIRYRDNQQRSKPTLGPFASSQARAAMPLLSMPRIPTPGISERADKANNSTSALARRRRTSITVTHLPNGFPIGILLGQKRRIISQPLATSSDFQPFQRGKGKGVVEDLEAGRDVKTVIIV